LADPTAWFECFDVVQLNEDEMRQLSPDPLSLSAQALGAGTSLLVVTLGPKGAAYVAAAGFDGLPVEGFPERAVILSPSASSGQAPQSKEPAPEAWPLRGVYPERSERAQGDSQEGSAVARASRLAARTALVPAPQIDAVDPTGCGDVFGAAACARLLAGDRVEDALRRATAMAARNATLRGAGGLSRHLRGELLVP
jgi:sugar/nucleoside kinase (ribokinase family)